MIDVHCHLEQKDYDPDREAVIERSEKSLKAVVTSCANPNDYEKTVRILKNHKGFIFASFALHPIHIKEFSEEDIEKYFKKIRKSDPVSIGETGLDYHWVSEPGWRKKQEELFRNHIMLAKDMKLPLTIHARDSQEKEGAVEKAFDILEQEYTKRVHLHLFGKLSLLGRAEENGWYISIGPLVRKSKSFAKIAKRFPLERIMLETDAPWFGEDGRNEPTSVISVAERIAAIRKIPFESAWNAFGENAVKFFNLKF